MSSSSTDDLPTESTPMLEHDTLDDSDSSENSQEPSDEQSEDSKNTDQKLAAEAANDPNCVSKYPVHCPSGAPYVFNSSLKLGQRATSLHFQPEKSPHSDQCRLNTLEANVECLKVQVKSLQDDARQQWSTLKTVGFTLFSWGLFTLISAQTFYYFNLAMNVGK